MRRNVKGRDFKLGDTIRHGQRTGKVIFAGLFNRRSCVEVEWDNGERQMGLRRALWMCELVRRKRVLTAEHKAKIAAAHRGKLHTAATLRKMSLAARRRITREKSK